MHSYSILSFLCRFGELANVTIFRIPFVEALAILP